MSEGSSLSPLQSTLKELQNEIHSNQQLIESLKQSEARFRLLYENSPLPSQSLDISGRIVDVNLMWLNSFGYTRREVIGTFFIQYLHHDEIDNFAHNFETLKTIGLVSRVEFQMFRKDGSLVYVSLDGIIEKNEEGTFQQSYCLLYDVTEQKTNEKLRLKSQDVLSRTFDAIDDIVTIQDANEHKEAERKLRESETKFVLAFNACPDAIAINRLDDGLYVDINSAFTELTGFTIADIRGKTYIDTSILYDLADRKRLAESLDTKGYCKNLEAKVCRKDGSIITALMSARIISLDGVPHLISITRDITGQQKAEAERDRLIAAIEQTSDAIVITDREANIQYVNPAFEKVTGYTRQEVLGKNPRILKSGDQDEQFYLDLWHTLTNGRTFKGRMINRRKSGRLFTEEVTISPILDRKGQVVSFVAVKRDITDQILLESQLQQAQKMEAVGCLVGGVAHDFNNTLAVIIGYTEMALGNTEPTEQLHGDLTKILDAAGRSADIVHQLLAFSRKQTITPKVLDLNEAVTEMINILQHLIGEDIELLWQPGANLSPVKMDPTQIDQILANLCVNSKDAIVGFGTVNIETSMVSFGKEYCAHHIGFHPGKFVQLTVSDSGCGIDKETQNHIFEPFFSTKKLGEGTGLGLSTVYGIVKQNNGFINIYSELGSGTTFKIYFQASQDELPESKEENMKEIGASQRETILLVEDEPVLLEMAEKMLELLDYTVLKASRPSEALQIAEEYGGSIDLLFTDVVMPEMTGKELAEIFQSRCPKLKVLFTSGYTANVIAQNGILDEGVLFIQKPYSLDSLAGKLRDILSLESA